MKKGRDVNQWAADAVAAVTGLEVPKGVLAALLKRQEAAKAAASAAAGKNPAAIALGHLGGLKGGKARAKSLTATERSEIARKGAQARWAKEKKVVALVRGGKTTREIANKLGISVETASTHRERVMAKMRAQLESTKQPA